MTVVMIILGILMILSGISCVVTPVATFSALGWLTGIAILAVGFASILQYAAGHEKRSIWELLGGICGVLFGGFLILNNFAQLATNIVLAYAASFWLLVHGICGIAEALKLRKLNQAAPDDERSAAWLLVMLLGILTIFMGITCVTQPILSMISVGWLMGASILTSGVKTLVLAVRSFRKK